LCWSLIAPRGEVGEVYLPVDEAIILPGSETLTAPQASLYYRDWAGWSSMLDTVIRFAGGAGWGHVAPPSEGTWHTSRVHVSVGG
jgi:hypothetical protein